MEAGYVPTDAEVSAAQKWLQPFMDEWKGPAYMTDFSWRFLGCNEPAARVLGLPKDDLQGLLRKKPTLLDLAFDPRLPARRRIPEETFPSFGRGQIARFKVQQRDRTGQRWYRKLLRRLMSVPSFAELWDSTPGELGSALMDYSRMQFKTPFGGLEFHTFASGIVSDPRLFVILWLPADRATAESFFK